jgi:hypothetical protein
LVNAIVRPHNHRASLSLLLQQPQPLAQASILILQLPQHGRIYVD